MRYHYQFYATITVLSWGIGNVLTRVALRDFSPFAIGFWRYVIATVMLAILVVAKKISPPAKADLPWFVFSGFTGFAFYMVAYNMGYVTVTAATGSVISATVPLMTAALAWLIFKETLKAFQWFGVLLQFLGIVIIALAGGRFSVSEGVLWTLLSALSLSVYNLLQRKMTEKYSALQCSIYSIFCGTIMLAVFAPRSVHELSSARVDTVFAVAFLGIFASAVAFLSWTKALSLADKASQVSNFMFITPLISTGLEIALFRELPGAATLFGGVVILLGAFLFGRSKEHSYR
ncbi:DMT family transporter [Oscillospiraceae bacterium LTW-04]|nr:DMT family transporter [Oscillospiraceae bacterium MB24-C1]